MSGTGGGGTLIGEYGYKFSLVTDYNAVGTTMLLEIDQADGTLTIPGANNTGRATVTSAFQYGVPFLLRRFWMARGDLDFRSLDQLIHQIVGFDAEPLAARHLDIWTAFVFVG